MFNPESAVLPTKSRLTLFKSTKSSFDNTFASESKSYFNDLLINPELFYNFSASESF